MTVLLTKQVNILQKNIKVIKNNKKQGYEKIF